VKQLRSGRGGQVIVPWTILYWAASGMRGWPGWMQEGARNSIGGIWNFLGMRGLGGGLNGMGGVTNKAVSQSLAGDIFQLAILIGPPNWLNW
jgi:hypothetical protein